MKVCSPWFETFFWAFMQNSIEIRVPLRQNPVILSKMHKDILMQWKVQLLWAAEPLGFGVIGII
jgi:hypothetical protein